VADKNQLSPLGAKNMNDVFNHHFLPILIIIDVFWYASFAIK
jgi:hypothetical protein